VTQLASQPPKWYRQFWPWFLIVLPLSVVIAGFCTLYIALQHPHSMVDDQYYQQGLAINQSLDQDRHATELGISAEVLFTVSSSAAQVLVRLSGLADYPQALSLQLLHPVSQARDQTLTLKATAPGHYSARLNDHYQHGYYLRLMPAALETSGTPAEKTAATNNWRLNGRVDFSGGADIAVSLLSASTSPTPTPTTTTTAK
jgi:hypothetical protein